MPQRFSFQLYSARDFLPWTDIVPMLAKAGYGAVEGYGDVYKDAKSFRALLDGHGLTMPSGHFAIEMLEEKPKQALAIARSLGMSTLIVPWLAEDQRPTTAKGWKELGRRLNTIARTYRAEGLAVAWHNHDFEFVALKDGSIPLDHLFASAPQLDWEIDVAWVVRSKSNALKFIKKYGHLITHAHVKDMAPKGQNADQDGWTDVGAGTVNWAACFAELRQSRCMHYVMEHDKPADLKSFAAKSISGARNLWGE